jgi:Dolichyl-phosphate-mannose-protein mannosyltransferase
MLQKVNKNFLLLLSLGFIGMLAIFYSTRWGIGLNQDSLFYIGGAESILRGQGFSYLQQGEMRTITKWPPLYSLVLAMFGMISTSVFAGARWVNALLFGINIVLVGRIVMVKTARLWPALLASSLMLMSGDMLTYHALAVSEPLYILFGLGALYFLDKYIQEASIYHLILGSLLVSAATLTRYIGVSLIATLCISLLIFSRRTLRERLIDCVVAGLVSSLPLLLWQVRNWQLSRSEAPLASGAELARVEFQTHLIEGRHLEPALGVVSSWLVPRPLPISLQVLGLVVVLLVFLLIVIRSQRGNTFIYLNATYVVVYCSSLVFFISFASRDIYFDSRYLLPVFVSTVLVITIWLGQMAWKSKPVVRIATIVLCVLLPLFYIRNAAAVVLQAHHYGLGFASPTWTQSTIVNSIKYFPSDVRIYSNMPISVIFLTRRQVNALPYKFDPNSEKPFDNYLEKLREIGTTSKDQRTLIFYLPGPICFPSEDDLRQTMTLKKIATGPEGSLYEVSP